MEWGIHLPHLGRQASREALITFAQKAEALGFHSGWVSDHVVWPRDITSKYPYTDDGSFPATPDMAWLDPIGTMFFVAAVTERIKLAPTVLVLGYRPPILTAKAIASLDVLSGGRVIFGVGVGWMREEFDVIGMPFDHRGARADEQLELFQVLVSQENPSFDGRYYSIPEVGFEPKPVQDHIPIWVGGSSEPAFKRVVRFGDAFHAAFEPVETVKASWARIGELCDEAGRSRDELTLSIRLYLDPASIMTASKSVAGSPAQMLDTIGAWRDIGVTNIVLDPVTRGGIPGRMEAIEAFMDQVGSQAD